MDGWDKFRSSKITSQFSKITYERYTDKATLHSIFGQSLSYSFVTVLVRLTNNYCLALYFACNARGSVLISQTNICK